MPDKITIRARLRRQFTQDLAILLIARMPLTDSIDILRRQYKDDKFQKILLKVNKQLKGGKSLAEAIQEFPRIFNPFYRNLVEVGESTGQLGDMLQRISDYETKMAGLQRKLLQALTYPALVIAVAILAVGFILAYVVPAFADIFHDFGATLPLPTRIVIESSHLVTQNTGIILSLLTVFLVLIGFGRKQPQLLKIWERGLLKMPLLGNMIAKNYIAQVCRTLGTLLGSGVGLLPALELIQQSIQHHLVKADILQMKRLASKGGRLSNALKKAAVFPFMVVQMIDVGEETAELPKMLLRVADYYDSELDSAIETLASVIEPLVIIVLGGIIGAILISIYLPLFNMSTVIG